MSIYRPTYPDKKTGDIKISKIWWYHFTFAGRHIQESSKSTRKTIAIEAAKKRRLELEKTFAGMPLEKREDRVSSVAEVLKIYEARYRLDHRNREQSVLFSKYRLAHVKRLLGKLMLHDLTEDVIRGYISTRIEEKVCGHTINNEVGELSRAIGRPWSVLWPKVPRLEERKDVGKALSPEQEGSLLDAAAKKVRWRVASVIIRVALLT